MTRTLAMVLALTTLTAGVASAEHRTLQQHADALLAHGAPGVLVELDTPRGERKVRSGHGDVDDHTPVPWRARYRIGSYTKTYVATVALQLVGERRLSLEDTVERWLPGLVPDGRITVRQLLQHTSGLPDHAELLPWLRDQEGFLANRFRTYTPEELVALAVSRPPTFPPGGGWRYSNTGYLLAGMIIERVTGNDWRVEVRDRILRPLRLRDTSLPGTDPRVPSPHATAYQRFPDGDTFLPAIDVTAMNPSWGGAAGEMISTTEDGNRFLRALLGGRLLKPAQLNEMRTTVRAAAFDPAWPGVRYGLGLMWAPNSCGGMWFHGGDIHGFKTRNGATADGRRSVQVTINTDSMIPTPGTPPPTEDHANDLIDHALCDR